MKSLRTPFLILAVVLSAILVTSCSRQKDLRFTIVYEKADNLAPGQFVTYKGLMIGRVLAVDFDETGRIRVEVEIDKNRTDLVHREAKFEIRKPNGNLDLTGEREIAMSDRSGTRTPILKGDVIDGYDGLLDDLGQTASSWADALKDLIDAGAREVRDVLQSPEAQEFFREADEYQLSLREATKEEAERFLREDYPRLEEKARAIKDDLERQGLDREAREFWTKFEERTGAQKSSQGS